MAQIYVDFLEPNFSPGDWNVIAEDDIVYDQVMGFFYPFTQRHYRRLIYYLYYYIATCFGRTTIIKHKIYINS
jgi:hypothetical protein